MNNAMTMCAILAFGLASGMNFAMAAWHESKQQSFKMDVTNALLYLSAAIALIANAVAISTGG